MNAVEYIQHWEGFRPRLYLCPAGYPTIGYGTRVATWRLGDLPTATDHLRCGELLRALIAADTGDWITREQATALMLPAVEAAQRAVLAAGLTPYIDELDSPRGIALTDIGYNMGSDWVKKFPACVAAIKAYHWQRAHDELLYVNAGFFDSARKKMAEAGAGTVARIVTVDEQLTAYYRQTGRRAECNARVLLTGEMPEVLP